MKWLKKIGRFLSTFILGFLLVITIIMTIYVADVRATAMNSDWVKSEMDNGGFYPAVRSELSSNLKESLTEDMDADIGEKISNTIDATVTDEWAKANFEDNADIAYAYLKSESDNLGLSVSLPPSLKQGLKDAIADYFTAKTTGLTQAQIDKGLAAVYKQVDNLPSSISIQIENPSVLQPVRDGIKLYNYTYYILIALLILLSMLLILLHFKLKDAMRVIGFNFLIGGAISLAAAIAVGKFAPDIVGDADLGNYITKDMVVQVIKDLVSPANAYAIAFIVVAIVLIIASFFVGRKPNPKSKKAAEQAAS